MRSYDYSYWLVVAIGGLIFVHIHTSVGASDEDEADMKKSLVLTGFYTMLSLPVCMEYDFRTESYIYVPFSNEYAVYFCGATDRQLGLLENYDQKFKNCIFSDKHGKPDNCEKRVEPAIIKSMDKSGEHQKSCGKQRQGKLFNYVFQPCYMDEKNKIYLHRFIRMYEICYDVERKHILYTFHRIHSPILLNSIYLENDRKKVYKPSINDFGLFNNDDDNVFKNSSDYISKHINSDLSIRYVVTPKDMAFMVWKRAVFHYINAVLILKKTAHILDHIEQFIRDQAIEFLGEIYVINGLDEFESYNTRIPKIWWKMVYSEQMKSAIGIVIHNVYESLTDQDKLCQSSICEEYGWSGLIPSEAVSHAYCCKAKDVADKYGVRSPKKTLNLNGFWRRYFTSSYHRYQYNCPKKNFTFLKYIPL